MCTSKLKKCFAIVLQCILYIVALSFFFISNVQAGGWDKESSCLCANGNKPTALLLKYTGATCASSSHQQESDKASCIGNTNSAPEVHIVVSDDSNPYALASSAEIYFSDTVYLDDNFTADSKNANEDKFDSNTYIHILNSTQSQVLQTIQFHTSCSQPLFDGDSYGAITIIDGFKSNQALCSNCVDLATDYSVVYGGTNLPGRFYDSSSDTTTFNYTVTSEGGSCRALEKFMLEVPECIQAPLQLIDYSPIFSINPDNPSQHLSTIDDLFALLGLRWTGGDGTASPLLVEPHDSQVYSVKFAGNLSESAIQYATSRSKNTAFTDCLCADGSKPNHLVMEYNGGSCIDSNHNQGIDKSSCTGDANDTPVVWIVVASKDDLTDDKAEKFFEGFVSLNESFAFSAIGDKFESNTYAFVFDNTKQNLLQSINFHTSCSAELTPGDQHGSLVLLSGSFNGTVICETCIGNDCSDINYSNTTGAACPYCGDGVVYPPEECDDGNNINGDGCQANCTIPFCGDGIMDPGEECDDGNNIDGDGCQSNCMIPFCGDGIMDAGEECDDGNNIDGDGCQANCQIPYCGDGIMDAGEQCDDGNNIDGDGCQADCSIPFCGDGIVDQGEQCDDGNNIDGDGCQANCQVPFCGDGIKDPNEACDDGNNIDGDGCQADCTLPFCGDGTLDQGEQCDDGNNIDGDGCQANCLVPFCGDGILDPGEQCDDGNNIDGDKCSSKCENPFCGDGILQPELGEECDDGNNIDGDGCSASCNSNENCEPYDITSVQGTIDGGLKEQERVIKKVLRRIKKFKRLPKFSKNVATTAHDLQIEGWILSWSIPSTGLSCDFNASVCTADNINKSAIESYIVITNDLHKLLLKSLRKVRKLSGNNQAGRIFLKRGKQLLKRNIKFANGIPGVLDNCILPDLENI